jgi:hypothetical protein
VTRNWREERERERERERLGKSIVAKEGCNGAGNIATEVGALTKRSKIAKLDDFAR